MLFPMMSMCLENSLKGRGLQIQRQALDVACRHNVEATGTGVPAATRCTFKLAGVVKSSIMPLNSSIAIWKLRLPAVFDDFGVQQAR